MLACVAAGVVTPPQHACRSYLIAFAHLCSQTPHASFPYPIHTFSYVNDEFVNVSLVNVNDELTTRVNHANDV